MQDTVEYSEPKGAHEKCPRSSLRLVEGCRLGVVKHTWVVTRTALLTRYRLLFQLFKLSMTSGLP